MKMKSLAMLAMSGLLTASFAYITPAMADDFGGDDQATQVATGDNPGAAQDGAAQGSNSTASDSGATGTGAASDGSDDGSAVQDTPSGDDDY